MIACPLCLQKDLDRSRPGKWESYLRCRCGACYQIKCRYAWPHYPSLALRRCEPIRFPSPGVYFHYMSVLKGLFARMRSCVKVEDETRRLFGEMLPLCDMLRFGDKDADLLLKDNAKAYLKLYEQDMALWNPVMNPWRLVPDDFAEFHTNCDFASWCMERISDGRFSDDESAEFGYIVGQHFPFVHGYWSKNSEIEAAWKKAAKGLLPTSRRAQVRSRMHW